MDGTNQDGMNPPQPVTEGEFAGWQSWKGSDPFEDQSGPFFFKVLEDGTVHCAFRAERKHMNGGGFMHGGCMLTFADFSLFAFAHKELEGVHSVTVSLNGEFIGPANEGDHRRGHQGWRLTDFSARPSVNRRQTHAELFGRGEEVAEEVSWGRFRDQSCG